MNTQPRHILNRAWLAPMAAMALACGVCGVWSPFGGNRVFGDRASELFENRIRPVLVEHCYECHSSLLAEPKGGLTLDHRAGWQKGGDSGPALEPGKPQASLLLAALRHDSLEMPPKGKLPEKVIEDFREWIALGAYDRAKAPTIREAAEELWEIEFAKRRQWWSLQPPRTVEPPQVITSTWPRDAMDQFVLAKLERQGLHPAKAATSETLLRRLSFVLTGLPPSVEQVASFQKASGKDADAALGSLVDQLLDSPQFGERFARHWMDVVRYTDTYGYEWDNPAKGSWEYRDYLIRAFNGDVGFDQMVREQIAGDLLPAPRIDRRQQTNESLIGPMFFHLGEHRHGSSLDFNGIHQEMINNKIEAFSKAFLGLTVACARCHDHKLDAISQADYYALAGVVMSPRWTSRVIDIAGKHDRQINELKRLRREVRAELVAQWRGSVADRVSQLKAYRQSHLKALKKTSLDDMLHPLAMVATATDENIAAQWESLAAEWRKLREVRRESNQSNFTTITDFSNPEFPDHWTVEGDGIRHGYVDHGAPLISLVGDTAVDHLLVRGYHTHALSSKLPGAVRLPPQHDMAGPLVSLQVQGAEWAGYLVAPQNAFQAESVKFFDPGVRSPTWLSLTDSGLKNGVTRVTAEVVTSSLNANFPPRTGLATAGKTKLPDHDEGFDKRSWFSMTGIVRHDAGGVPLDTLDVFQPLFDPNVSAPTTVEEGWTRLGRWFDAAVEAFCSTRSPLTRSDVEQLNWLLQEDLLPHRLEDSKRLRELVEQYRKIESEIAFARTANSMDESHSPALNYRLNVRGNVDDEGDAVPRDFLSAFAGLHHVADAAGSGRLELAEHLASGDNPQVARVYVNRLWHWVFGQGLVPTPNDFGKLGSPPSHPELLDYLAMELMRDGWSTKRMLRRLVLSATFRQSGEVGATAAEQDPTNRSLHHFALRRLEAEAIRDSMLAVSGRLDGRLYGRPINPHRTAEDGAKRLFSGPLESNGRRSIYIKMSIMEPPKFLKCFNLPDLKLPTGRRDATNDPAQALAMLNHPLVVQLARHWAERLTALPHATPKDRIRRMFLEALAREPNPQELQRWQAAVRSFNTAGSVMQDVQAWSELAHAMFNAKEFIYYR